MSQWMSINLIVLLLAATGIAEQPSSDEMPIEIRSLEQAESLPATITRISLNYGNSLRNEVAFDRLMSTLIQHPQIRHLKLRVYSSSKLKDDSLAVLQQFESLESLELVDGRSVASPSMFQHIVAIKNLKHLELSFL